MYLVVCFAHRKICIALDLNKQFYPYIHRFPLLFLSTHKRYSTVGCLCLYMGSKGSQLSVGGWMGSCRSQWFCAWRKRAKHELWQKSLPQPTLDLLIVNLFFLYLQSFRSLSQHSQNGSGCLWCMGLSSLTLSFIKDLGQHNETFPLLGGTHKALVFSSVTYLFVKTWGCIVRSSWFKSAKASSFSKS